MPRGGQFETGLTLFLADQAPELAQAHDELYPERVGEQIPLSLTLLYPFAPLDSLDESHLRKLRDFFGSGKPLAFDIARVAHASLTLDGGDDTPTLRDRVERRLEGLLPAHFEVDAVVLMEEYEADRWRIREQFRLGG